MRHDENYSLNQSGFRFIFLILSCEVAATYLTLVFICFLYRNNRQLNWRISGHQDAGTATVTALAGQNHTIDEEVKNVFFLQKFRTVTFKKSVLLTQSYFNSYSSFVCKTNFNCFCSVYLFASIGFDEVGFCLLCKRSLLVNLPIPC